MLNCYIAMEKHDFQVIFEHFLAYIFAHGTTGPFATKNLKN